MRLQRVLGVIGAVLLFSPLPCAANGKPRRLPSFYSVNNPYRGVPLWIAAEDALTPEGTLREGAIAPAEERVLANAFKHYEQQNARIDSAACGITFGPKFDFAPGMHSPQSWDDLEQRARKGVVVSGEVVELRAGLFGGTPATLLRIEPAKANGPLPFEAFVVYPRGSLTINGVRVCTHDHAYTDMPAVGDRVLFIADQALDEDGLLFAPPAEMIVYERGGRLVPSPAAKSRGLVPFKRLDELTRALIAQDARRPQR
jgi:hypothetical protein